MKTIAVISNLNVTKATMEELTAIYPEGKVGEFHFTMKLPPDDPRAKAVFAWLEREGYRRWEDTSRPRGDREYVMKLHRLYEATELAACEYLELTPSESVSGLFRDEHGHIKLERRSVRTRFDFASTNILPRDWIVVPNRTKKILEAGDFRHMRFRPTTLIFGEGAVERRNRVIPWEEYGSPWWEIVSDLILPPLSPRMDLRDQKGNPVKNADCSNGCLMYEEPYAWPEMHYDRSAFSGIESFDVAYTAEVFGNRGSLNTRAFVVSRRFYEYCVSRKLKTDWLPVRIETD